MRVLEWLPRRIGSFAAPALVLIVIPGCPGDGGEGLTIATCWPEARYQALEAEFRRAGGDPGPITWIGLAPGIGPDRAAGRSEGLDVLVGGPVSSYRALDRAGRLDRIEEAGSESGGGASWIVAGRSPVLLAVDFASIEARALPTLPGWPELGGPALRGLLALDDPRSDPIARSLARAHLAKSGWPEGYADLVRLAGNAQPFGNRSGAALARLGRGRAAVAPTILEEHEARTGGESRPSPVPLPEDPEIVEGAAVLRGARHPDRARSFLRFLASRAGLVESPERAESDEPPGTDRLLAALLGSTLVDAQDELRAACLALDRLEGPDRAGREARLVEPPPWPPASVQVLKGEDDPETWLRTLAGAIVPDPEARAWLLESWRAEPRPIDGDRLAELAGAVDGRLVAEPRFEAWLRAEWTAWAIQRYGRLATNPTTTSAGAPAS